MTWTRDQPTQNGKFWCAFRYAKKRKYEVMLVTVCGYSPESSVEPYLSSWIWGGAFPLALLRNIDIWWSPDPVPEPPIPLPPLYVKSDREPIR